MASDHVTFSLRMPKPDQYEALRSLASLHGVSIAEQARTYILDGLRRTLDDSAEIERQFETEKRRLLAVAAELNRCRAGQGDQSRDQLVLPSEDRERGTL